MASFRNIGGFTSMSRKKKINSLLNQYNLLQRDEKGLVSSSRVRLKSLVNSENSIMTASDPNSHFTQEQLLLLQRELSLSDITTLQKILNKKKNILSKISKELRQ